jgi:hypothetical protein
MGSHTVLAVLLSITIFYLFLSMYILARALGNRRLSSARRKKPRQSEAMEDMRIGRGLW